MRLIDAEAFLKSFDGAKELGVNAIKYYVDNTPTIDLVRCRECKWYAGEGYYCANNIIVQFDHFFCYYGERRADE